MIVIGLTGSIGMGKSVTSSMLRRLGCPVHDSDMAAHAALSPGGAAFAEVAVTFPQSWDAKKHIIRRDVLGRIVFADPAKKEILESIVHPAVRESQMRFLLHQKKTGAKIAALDIPLLFETGAQNRVDYTICVTAPEAVQRARVLARPGMTKERFEAILDAQMPDSAKRAMADFVVATHRGHRYTLRKLRNILKTLRHGRSS